MADGISVSEWMAELGRLSNKSADGFTTEEAAEQCGRSIAVTRLHMKKAFRAGLLELSGSRTSVRMDGRPCLIPVYRVVKKKGAK